MDFREWLNSDYYSLLGISQNATDDQINKAYRLKAKKTHPDIFPINSIERRQAEENFKKLLLAKETLLDREKREEYDKERQIIQEQYINYISNISFNLDKKEEKVNNKKTFSDVLNELIDKEENIIYDVDEENIYKKENQDISEEEKKIINNYEKARKFYELGIKAMRYGDNKRALLYFRSAKLLDPSIKIPILYYWKK